MLNINIKSDHVDIGSTFTLFLYRTLRVPDDGVIRSLPVGLGTFPLENASDYPGRVPPEWRRSGDVFLPIHRWEALWLGFRAAAWKPSAVRIAVGRVNAITGGPDMGRLQDDPQDYLVCPGQPWLDGINIGEGMVRQFVAAPLGAGETVEAQVTGRELFGGVQVTVFEPKPGWFPDQPPAPSNDELPAPSVGLLGLGAGGRIRQKLYPDPYGLDVWDQENQGRIVIHLVTAQDYHALTGREPPPSPITAATYARYGLPWFDLDDRERGTLAGAPSLADIRPVPMPAGGPAFRGGGAAVAADRSAPAEPSTHR